jgi:hypothetical protein
VKLDDLAGELVDAPGDVGGGAGGPLEDLHLDLVYVVLEALDHRAVVLNYMEHDGVEDR